MFIGPTFFVWCVLAGQSDPIQVSYRTTLEERKGWYRVERQYAVFRGGELATLATKQWKSFIDLQIAGLDIKENLGDEMPSQPWDFQSRSIVGTASKHLVSGYVEHSSYTGGAHPNRSYHGLTFGKAVGKMRRLTIRDFMAEKSDPRGLVSQWVLPKLKAMGASAVVDGSITSLSMEQTNNFVVTPAGITWLFSPYEVASYAEGHFFVKVTWAEMGSRIRKRP